MGFRNNNNNNTLKEDQMEVAVEIMSLQQELECKGENLGNAVDYMQQATDIAKWGVRTGLLEQFTLCPGSKVGGWTRTQPKFRRCPQMLLLKKLQFKIQFQWRMSCSWMLMMCHKLHTIKAPLLQIAMYLLSCQSSCLGHMSTLLT
jgi:hypothetical protein